MLDLLSFSLGFTKLNQLEKDKRNHARNMFSIDFMAAAMMMNDSSNGHYGYEHYLNLSHRACEMLKRPVQTWIQRLPSFTQQQQNQSITSPTSTNQSFDHTLRDVLKYWGDILVTVSEQQQQQQQQQQDVNTNDGRIQTQRQAEFYESLRRTWKWMVCAFLESICVGSTVVGYTVARCQVPVAVVDDGDGGTEDEGSYAMEAETKVRRQQQFYLKEVHLNRSEKILELLPLLCCSIDTHVHDVVAQLCSTVAASQLDAVTDIT